MGEDRRETSPSRDQRRSVRSSGHRPIDTLEPRPNRIGVRMTPVHSYGSRRALQMQSAAARPVAQCSRFLPSVVRTPPRPPNAASHSFTEEELSGFEADRARNLARSNALDDEKSFEARPQNAEDPTKEESLGNPKDGMNLFEGKETPFFEKSPALVRSRSMHLENKGFENLGNSCYMNALLQCLIVCEPFSADLFGAELTSRVFDPSSVKKRPKLYLSLLRLMVEVALEDHGAISTKLLKRSLRKYADAHGQEDAHEFFIEILSQLEKELAAFTRRPCRDHAGAGEGRVTATCTSPSRKRQKFGGRRTSEESVLDTLDFFEDELEGTVRSPRSAARSMSPSRALVLSQNSPYVLEAVVPTADTICPVSLNFTSCVRQSMRCQSCGATSSRSDVHRCFSLDLPDWGTDRRKNGDVHEWEGKLFGGSVRHPPSSPGHNTRRSCSIDSLLDNYFSDFILEKRCESCAGESSVVSQSLELLPRMLVLHLKRFRFDPERASFEKRADPVRILPRIDISRFCYGAKDLRGREEILPRPRRIENDGTLSVSHWPVAPFEFLTHSMKRGVSSEIKEGRSGDSSRGHSADGTSKDAPDAKERMLASSSGEKRDECLGKGEVMTEGVKNFLSGKSRMKKTSAISYASDAKKLEHKRDDCDASLMANEHSPVLRGGGVGDGNDWDDFALEKGKNVPSLPQRRAHERAESHIQESARLLEDSPQSSDDDYVDVRRFDRQRAQFVDGEPENQTEEELMFQQAVERSKGETRMDFGDDELQVALDASLRDVQTASVFDYKSGSDGDEGTFVPDTMEDSLSEPDQCNADEQRRDGTLRYQQLSSTNGVQGPSAHSERDYIGVAIERSIQDAVDDERRRAAAVGGADIDVGFGKRNVQPVKSTGKLWNGVSQSASSFCQAEDSDAVLGEKRKRGEDDVGSYQLQSIVYHLGRGTGSGHYVSDVCDVRSGSWRTFNDSVMREIPSIRVLSEERQQSVYLLFYQHSSTVNDPPVNLKGARSFLDSLGAAP